MLNCKQMVDLVSQSLDTSLPWWKRLEMKMHLLICKTCHRYLQQMQFIHRMARTIDSHNGHIKLSQQAKDRIKQSLKNQQSY